MWRCRDLAVADADYARRACTVRVEQEVVIGTGDERLICQREHRCSATRHRLDRNAERASHASLVLRVDGVTYSQMLKSCDDALVLGPHGHYTVIETGR